MITVADAEYTKILLHKFSIPFIEKHLAEMLGAFYYAQSEVII